MAKKLKQGPQVAHINDYIARELINNLLEWGQGVDDSLGRLSVGQLPDGKGTPIPTPVDLSNYVYMPGRVTEQIIQLLRPFPSIAAEPFGLRTPEGLTGGQISGSPVFVIEDFGGTRHFEIDGLGAISSYDDTNWVAPGGVPLLLNLRVKNIAWGGDLAHISSGTEGTSNDIRSFAVQRSGFSAGMLQTDNYKPVMTVGRELSSVNGNPFDQFVVMNMWGDRNLLTLNRGTTPTDIHRMVQFTASVAGGIDLPDTILNVTTVKNSIIITTSGNFITDGLAVGDLLTDSTHFPLGTRVLSVLAGSATLSRPALKDSGPVTLNFQSDIFTYISNDFTWVGPVVGESLVATANTIIENDVNVFVAAGATYTAGNTTITGVGLFGSSAIGQMVVGPDFIPGTKITVRGNNSVVVDKAPLVTHGGGGETLYYGYGAFLKDRLLNRYVKLALDSDDDAVTTYFVSRNTNQRNVTIPSTDYANIFTAGQEIHADAAQVALRLFAGGTYAVVLDDGVGNALYTLDEFGAVTSLADRWYQTGIPSIYLNHSVTNLSVARAVAWPDVSGTVVVSPSPLSIINTSANVTGGTLYTTSGSNNFYRVSIRMQTNTSGDRSASFVLKWTDGVARTATLNSPGPLGSGSTFGVLHFFRVSSGNITYDLTFSGTTGTADVFAVVERMT